MRIVIFIIFLIIFIYVIIKLYNNARNEVTVNDFLDHHTPNYIKSHKKNFKDAQALVLICIDFRFLTDYVLFLRNNNLGDSHDSYVVAGASLIFNPFVEKNHPSWKNAFLEHLELAKGLHIGNLKNFKMFIQKDYTNLKQKLI